MLFMSTTLTENPSGIQAKNIARLSALDIVTLLCALVLAVSFLILPWTNETETSLTGIGLLISGSLPFSADLLTAVQNSRSILLFIPLAILLAIAGVVWSKVQPQKRSAALWLMRFAGILGLAYFVLYGIQDRQNTTLALIQSSGGGFWLGFVASAILLAQFLFIRDTAVMVGHAESYSGQRGGLRHMFRGLLDNPRFVRGVTFVFRFQSFFGLIIVILLAIIFSPVRNDNNLFLSQRNLSNVARDVAETGILAVGQILVIIIGGIDLAVGSVVALAATGVAFLLMRDLVPAIPAILIILSLGAFIGWWNGWTAERFKIPSFVTTLAMLSIARGIAHIWSNDIAVPLSYGAGGADPLFGLIGERINGIFPVPAIIMFVVATIMALILHYTAFGRHLYAIGGNQTAARLSGLAVSRIKIFAFMLCGFFASMAGILHAAQLNQGSPNEAVGYELNAIAAVVIGGASLSGGKGTIVGAIAGAFILGILDNMLSLNNVNSNIQLVTKGLLVVAAVALQQLRPRSAA
jgi:ribose transport system permease protein